MNCVLFEDQNELKNNKKLFNIKMRILLKYIYKHKAQLRRPTNSTHPDKYFVLRTYFKKLLLKIIIVLIHGLCKRKLPVKFQLDSLLYPFPFVKNSRNKCQWLCMGISLTKFTTSREVLGWGSRTIASRYLQT